MPQLAKEAEFEIYFFSSSFYPSSNATVVAVVVAVDAAVVTATAAVKKQITLRIEQREKGFDDKTTPMYTDVSFSPFLLLLLHE